MAKFTVTLGIGFANGTHREVIEIPDDELEGLDENARANVLDEYWKEWAWNYIDGGIFPVDEEENET